MGNKKRKSRSAILAKKTAKLCKQQDYRCYYCKYPILARTDMFGDVPGVAMNEILPPVGWDFATFDHKKPKCAGGDSYNENFVACCQTCNEMKGSSSFELWMVNTASPHYRVQAHINRLNYFRKKINSGLPTCSNTNVVWFMSKDKTETRIPKDLTG